MTKIKVVPELAVMDDQVDIAIADTKPHSALTISASIVWYNILYIGYGHFYSDDQGYLNLKQHISYGGTYKGLQSMGLFTSMRAMPSKSTCPRLIVKGSVEKNLPYEINVWKGHLTQDQVHQLHVKYPFLRTAGSVHDFYDKFFLANCSCQRTYMSSNVKRILVKIEFENEPIRGVLFIPYGRGQFPGVIDLFGVDGGCSEFRSALFAKHGFASFALAYFGYDGLKATTFQKVELSYFDKAIKWFCNHPQVKAGRVSMIGSSLGARAALLSSFRNSQIHSTICINASHFIPSDPNIKTLQQPHMQSYEMWQGRMTHIQGNKYKCSRPVLSHKHDNPILFLVGELDLYSSSVDDVIDQLRKSGKKNVSKVIIAGQGHFIEPPYTPACTVATAFRTGTTKSNDPYMRIMDDLLQEWGGSYENNGPGQIEAWRIVLDVLRESSFSFQQNYSANFYFSKL